MKRVGRIDCYWVPLSQMTAKLGYGIQVRSEMPQVSSQKNGLGGKKSFCAGVLCLSIVTAIAAGTSDYRTWKDFRGKTKAPIA